MLYPVIQYVWVWWSLHLNNGEEDVVNVISEVQDGVGDDSLGGSDAGRQQGQSGGEWEWRLKLLHCHFLKTHRKPIVLEHTEPSIQP